ncbi:hypothetical protein CMT52_08740 [Elizabethkingia anophelis]|nr:hypothetical protein [Elizabethkingia anophelis]
MNNNLLAKTKGLVKTKEDALLIFSMIFKDQGREALEEGVLIWLEKNNDPKAVEAFLKFPELLEDHTIFDLIVKDKNTDTGKEDYILSSIGIASLASCLQLAINCFYEFWCLECEKCGSSDNKHKDEKEQEQNEEPEFSGKDIIEYITINISLTDFQSYLFTSILSIVGESYYNLFLNKLGSLGAKSFRKEFQAFDNDPEIQEHLQLMLWFANVRFFLNAMYLYFEKESESDQNFNSESQSY